MIEINKEKLLKLDNKTRAKMLKFIALGIVRYEKTNKLQGRK